MESKDYKDLTDLEILQLAVWREAQNQPRDGMRGVAHVIRNRVYGKTKWWGAGDWHNVILKPYQFSSFNPNDPNSAKWPEDYDISWNECRDVCVPIYNADDEDITLGATYYHDTSIGWPHSWGNPADYEQTLAVGDLLFFKPRPAQTVMGADESTQV